MSNMRRLSAQANEADIRVVPEPGLLLVLVAGIVVLAMLRRRAADGARAVQKGYLG